MNIDTNLNDVFDIQPHSSNTSIIEANGRVIAPTDDALDHDYNETRNNLHTLLQQGHEALTHALEVAKQSEHPRAFEVVGGLMKNLSDINHQLLDLHRKKQTIGQGKDSDSSETKTVNNNAIFVGNTSELSKMIADMRKGK